MLSLARLRHALLVVGTVVSLARSQAASPDISKMVPLRTHSIYAPYVDQDLQNRWFDFGGEAYVNTNKYIRLTQDRQHETGWLWSRLPITVSNFQIDIEFKISGGVGHLFGDGMAIWITKSRAEYGPVFGSKDHFEGLGLFLDTYPNARHSYSFPRVVAMVGDGKTPYDQASDGESTAAAACSANIRRNDIKTMARIIYRKGESLQVLMQFRGWDEWTPCLEIKNMTLPSMPYLGLTAITGEVHDAHDVISISSSSLVINKADALANPNSSGKGRLHTSEEGGSWFGVLFKIFLLAAVCGAAYQGYIIYYVRGGRWSNKRF